MLLEISRPPKSISKQKFIQNLGGWGATEGIMSNWEIENATVLCFCHKIISTLVGEDGVVEWLRSPELNS